MTSVRRSRPTGSGSDGHGAEARRRRRGRSGVVAMIGFMGAGKSTRRPRRAEALGTVAIDVDNVIEERLGKPIARIFAEDGEAAFRAAEERITLELLAAPGSRVVALGGGAIGSPGCGTRWPSHLVVWIDVDVETAWARCQGSGRPLAGRPRAVRAPARRARAALCRSWPSHRVPHERSHRAGPRCWMRPPRARSLGARMLWAASASGDYPAYIGRRADRRQPVLARRGARPALPGHRRARGPALRGAPAAVRRTGGDHARRAVKDDRSRRDRVVRAGPGGDDPGRRGHRPGGRRRR